MAIYTLYAKGEPAGFFELDARTWPDVNLSYFGLMPGTIGSGTGFAFLRCRGRRGVAARGQGHDSEHLHRRPSAGIAELPARRVPHCASGAGDLVGARTA